MRRTVAEEEEITRTLSKVLYIRDMSVFFSNDRDVVVCVLDGRFYDTTTTQNYVQRKQPSSGQY